MLSSLRRWARAACVSLVLVFAFAGGASALSEVWVSANGIANFDIQLFSDDGVVVGSVTNTSYANVIAEVGNEVWIGNPAGTDNLRRYSRDGTFLNAFTIDGEILSINTIPEPSTALLLGIGLSALAATRRRSQS